MSHKGIYPLEPATAVGQFRTLYPDTVSVPLATPEAGYADYTELSDLDIEGFLAMSNESVFRAIGNYYLMLAGQAAKQSKVVKDTDLSISLTERAKDLRMVAEEYFDQAKEADVLAGTADIFDTFRFNGDLIDDHSEGTDFYIPEY